MMLISAIMPTRNRPQWAPRAMECFLSQSWPEKELVIVDDMDWPSFPQAPRDAGVEYHLIRQRLTIGAKRNLACSRAAGEIICHWDDDDWSAPERMADQVNRLLDSGLPVTGYHGLVFELENGECWRFGREPGYAVGTSLMYRRSYWRMHPFGDKNGGEDNDLVHRAQAQGAISTAEAGMLMLARVHGANTSEAYRKIGLDRAWQRVA